MYTVLDLLSQCHQCHSCWLTGPCTEHGVKYTVYLISVTVSSVSQLLVDRTVYRARCQVHGLPHQCHSVISVTLSSVSSVSSVSQLLVDRTVYRARCQVHGLPHQRHKAVLRQSGRGEVGRLSALQRLP